MLHNGTYNPDNGLNINASEWTGPSSFQLDDALHDPPTHAVLRSLTQQTAQVSLYPPSMDADARDRPICKFFLAGGCSRGDQCQFRHELPNDSSIADDAATGVTGIVFNLNAKNTGTALHKQTYTDDPMYADGYSPTLNPLSQSSTDYYGGYPGSLDYSQYTSSSGWSNQLSSEVDSSYRKNPASSYASQADHTAYGRSAMGSSGYAPAYIPSEQSQSHANIVAKGQNAIAGDNYWATTASSDKLIHEATHTYSMYQNDEIVTTPLSEGAPGTRPMSYAAIAQRKKAGVEDSPSELVSISGLDSPGLRPTSSKHLHTPSPKRGDLKHPDRSQDADMDPPWKPVSKPKAKHAPKPSDKKGRRSADQLDADEARGTPDSARLSPISGAHPPASYKIQLPNPHIWGRRTLDEPRKSHLRAIVHTVAGSASPGDGHAPPTPGEGEILKAPAALSLDGETPPKGKKPSPAKKDQEGKAKPVRTAQKMLAQHLKEKKADGERGPRQGRGRGYGGQAYHDTRLEDDKR